MSFARINDGDVETLPPDAPLANRKCYCSFCARSNVEVGHLIAGPTVFICDECVGLCVVILNGLYPEAPALPVPRASPPSVAALPAAAALRDALAPMHEALTGALAKVMSQNERIATLSSALAGLVAAIQVEDALACARAALAGGEP